MASQMVAVHSRVFQTLRLSKPRYFCSPDPKVGFCIFMEVDFPVRESPHLSLCRQLSHPSPPYLDTSYSSVSFFERHLLILGFFSPTARLDHLLILIGNFSTSRSNDQVTLDSTPFHRMRGPVLQEPVHLFSTSSIRM